MPGKPQQAESETLPPTQNAQEKHKSTLREIVETLLLALVIFLVARTLVMNYLVFGPSMQPTIQEGQLLLIDKVHYHYFDSPQRGDIIVLVPPDITGQTYIKRVIGLPGETVEIREGQVFINGAPLEEPWETVPSSDVNWGPATVGEGELFVLGDNRPGSRDSRYFGMLPQENVIGRTILCYWPLDKVRFYTRYDLKQSSFSKGGELWNSLPKNWPAISIIHC